MLFHERVTKGVRSSHQVWLIGTVGSGLLFERYTDRTYALISDHPGGLTPGTYGGIARDLLTFVANFWSGTGALDRFCTSEARYTGKDPRDL